jgi:hypothetical protein
MRAFEPGEQDEKFDSIYRTMIAFLPGTGSFYCARERRQWDGGVDKSLVPHDMSWLRMKRDHDVHGTPFYTFIDDGIVCSLYSESTGSNPVDNRKISLWRVSLGKILCLKRSVSCIMLHNATTKTDQRYVSRCICWQRCWKMASRIPCT